MSVGCTVKNTIPLMKLKSAEVPCRLNLLATKSIDQKKKVIVRMPNLNSILNSLRMFGKKEFYIFQGLYKKFEVYTDKLGQQMVSA